MFRTSNRADFVLVTKARMWCCVANRCFEVLGYDVMVDSNLNPWVIEVNHLPR